MKRIPNEPTFIFATSTTVQVWTLADYLRYYAVDYGWSRSLHAAKPRMGISLIAYEANETLDLIPDLHAEDIDAPVETAVVDGVPFVRVPMDLRLQIHGDYDDYPGTRMMVWVPDLDKEIPDITPWEWTEDGLKITLRLPGE